VSGSPTTNATNLWLSVTKAFRNGIFNGNF